jgi:hypothetical protein
VELVEPAHIRSDHDLQESVRVVTAIFLSDLSDGILWICIFSYLAWPGLLLAVNAFINQHPLRTKDGAPNTGPLYVFITSVAFGEDCKAHQCIRILVWLWELSQRHTCRSSSRSDIIDTP